MLPWYFNGQWYDCVLVFHHNHAVLCQALSFEVRTELLPTITPNEAGKVEICAAYTPNQSKQQSTTPSTTSFAGQSSVAQTIHVPSLYGSFELRARFIW